jgi:hypothetical protein
VEFKSSDLIAKKRREESLKHTNLGHQRRPPRRGESLMPAHIAHLFPQVRKSLAVLSGGRRAGQHSHRSIDFFFCECLLFEIGGGQIWRSYHITALDLNETITAK